jgi:photosystem II stability/assembly factor-like uncharacterized protein
MSPFKGPLKTNAKESAMKFLQLLLILLLFSFSLHSQNGNWEELGPNGWNNIQSWSPGVGRVNCFAVDPNDSDIILAGTYSGVWKTVDGGIHWSPLNEQKKYKNIQTIAIDPSNSDTYYIGTYNSIHSGLFRSNDAGATWTWLGDIDGLPNPPGYVHYINYILLHPTNSDIIYVSKNGSQYETPKPGVYRSLDGGVTWSFILESADIDDMEFKPTDPNVLYVGGRNFYRSPDGGDSWAVISGLSSEQNDVKMIGVSEDDPEKVYVLESDALRFGAFYVSDNSGLSFTALDHGSNNYFGNSTSADDDYYVRPNNMSIAVSDINAEEVHIGGNISWSSMDGGLTFSATSNIHYFDAAADNLGYCHQSLADMNFHNGVLYVSTSGGIYKAEDTSTINSDYYTDISGEMGIRWVYGLDLTQSSNPTIAISSAYNGSSLRRPSDDWVDWLGGGASNSTFIDKNDNNIVYSSSYFDDGGVADKNIYRTDDGGNSYNIVPKPFTGFFYDEAFKPDPIDVNTIYLAKDKLYKSTNKGLSWTSVSPQIASGNPMNHLQISPVDNQKMYISGFSQLYKSADGGVSWSSISMPQELLGTKVVAIHPTNPNIIALISEYYTTTLRLFVSFNGGSSWINYRKNLPELNGLSIVWDDNGKDGLYVGLENGVYYIDNTRDNWAYYSDNLPTIGVTKLAINNENGKIYAGTRGRGVWASPKCDDCVLSIDEDIIENQIVFYPNPANQFIKIVVKEPLMSGSIKIVDLMGKTIIHKPKQNIEKETILDISSLSPGL